MAAEGAGFACGGGQGGRGRGAAGREREAVRASWATREACVARRKKTFGRRLQIADRGRSDRRENDESGTRVYFTAPALRTRTPWARRGRRHWIATPPLPGKWGQLTLIEDSCPPPQSPYHTHTHTHTHTLPIVLGSSVRPDSTRKGRASSSLTLSDS